MSKISKMSKKCQKCQKMSDMSKKNVKKCQKCQKMSKMSSNVKKFKKVSKMSKKDMIPRYTTDDDDSQVHDRRVLRYTTSCTYRRHNDSYRNHRRVPTYGYDSQVHDINGSGFAAISPPDGVEIRVRGQNRGFLAWRVHF